jgi:hypothetical protein
LVRSDQTVSGGIGVEDRDLKLKSRRRVRRMGDGDEIHCMSIREGREEKNLASRSIETGVWKVMRSRRGSRSSGKTGITSEWSERRRRILLTGFL